LVSLSRGGERAGDSRRGYVSDEDKYRIARVELVHICPQYGNFEGQELEFNYTLRTLALHVVGSHALPLDRRATAACSARRICVCFRRWK